MPGPEPQASPQRPASALRSHLAEPRLPSHQNPQPLPLSSRQPAEQGGLGPLLRAAEHSTGCHGLVCVGGAVCRGTHWLPRGYLNEIKWKIQVPAALAAVQGLSGHTWLAAAVLVRAPITSIAQGNTEALAHPLIKPAGSVHGGPALNCSAQEGTCHPPTTYGALEWPNLGHQPPHWPHPRLCSTNGHAYIKRMYGHNYDQWGAWCAGAL